MKLFLVSQTENNRYDTYDSFIVAAKTEEKARMTYPNPDEIEGIWDGKAPVYGSWCDAEFVEVMEIGTTNKYADGTILCSSFNAG